VDYFPAFLNLDGKACLLVGGGSIAARKARLLESAGARLTIVSPEITSALHSLVVGGLARHIRRRFRPGDVDGHWLVVSATGDEAVERSVAEAAEKQGIFCNAVDDRDNCSFITPAIVDRSPIVVAISSGGSAPVLARRIRTQIETLLPARLGDVARLAAHWRKHAAHVLKDFGSRLKFWEKVFDGRVEQLVVDGQVDDAEQAIADLLARADSGTDGRGIAWLVGAGPGDPDLLTIKALQAMQRADLILHDRLVSTEILALARRDAELISVGKTPGCVTNSQESTNELLVRLVREGNRVCRLKGGDPFIFGRGGEEAEALDAAGLPYSVVPGITAAAGCAAAAGIPLTHRDAAQSLVLLTAHGKHSIDTLDWPSLARDRQTLAVYMGVQKFPQLMRKLIEHGRLADTPVAIIERGTLADQRVVRGTLGQLSMLATAYGIRPPAMLIIGEVARFGANATDEQRRQSTRTFEYSTPKSAIQIA